MKRIDSLPQAQTRVYSYSYTFLFEFVLKLDSIAVRHFRNSTRYVYFFQTSTKGKKKKDPKAYTP